MRDEDLREEFAAWLRRVREADPPGLPVIAPSYVADGRGTPSPEQPRSRPSPASPSRSPRPLARRGSPPARKDTTSPLSLASSIPVTSSSPPPGPGGIPGSSSAYTVSRPVSTLVVSGGVGQVAITGSQRSRRLGHRAGPVLGTAARHDPHAGREDAHAGGYRCPDQSLCSASYDIPCPRGMAVQVSSETGGIRLSSLAGTVTAKSGTGLIIAAGLSLAPRQLRHQPG